MVSDVVSEAFLAWFLVCFRLVYDVVSGSWVINAMSMFITFGLFFDMVSDLFLARFLAWCDTDLLTYKRCCKYCDCGELVDTRNVVRQTVNKGREYSTFDITQFVTSA